MILFLIFSFILSLDNSFIISDLNASIKPAPERDSWYRTDDPFFLYQWGLVNQGQTVYQDIDDIHSQETQGKKGIDVGWDGVIHRLQKTPSSIVVAVLDSGVDLDHPDLQGQLSKNEIECDDGKIPANPKEDRDGNGFKGDCLGWNFASTQAGGDHRPYDDLGHGTHIAGIIAATSQNKLGITGIYPHLKILPVKVLKANENAGRRGDSLTDRIAKGIQYAVMRKVNVINLSLGWPLILESPALREAVCKALEANITIVAAAGNNGNSQPPFPCAYRGVICVGSVNIDGQLSAFSNFGGQVDVLAPGDHILSLYPQKLDPEFFSVKGYEVKNGTSQAAPLVAGTVGILKTLFPTIDADEIYLRLVSSSLSLSADSSLALGGLINIQRAINLNLSHLYHEKKVYGFYPLFKEMGNILLKGRKKDWSLNLKFKNYLNQPLEGIKIQVEIPKEMQDKIHLTQESWVLDRVDPKQVVDLHLQGEITDFEVDNQLPLTVKVEVKSDQVEKQQHLFHHQVGISRTLDEEELVTFPIMNSSESDNSQLMRLKTVTDIDQNLPFPEYYLTQVIPDQGLEVILVRHSDSLGQGQSYQVEKQKILIPKGLQLLFIMKLDCNFDGRLDYFIGSVTKEKVGDGADEEKQFLNYSFWSDDLQPLYAEESFWRFQPKEAFFKLDNLRIFAYSDSRWGKMIIPAFITEGKVPEKSLNPDPWEPEDTSVTNHLYYLRPIREEGSIHLQTWITDDWKFREGVRKKLKLRWNEQIDVLHSLPQAMGERQQGQLRILISVGRDFLRKYYLVTYRGPFQFDIQPFQNDSVSFEGSLLYPVRELEKSEGSAASAALLTQYNVHTLRHTLVGEGLKRGESFVHKQADLHDTIMGYIATYTLGQESFVFMQSKRDLILSWQSKLLSRPIQRFSFLPGNVFNEIFYPIVKKRFGHQWPALYVDATQIDTDYLYLITTVGREDGMKLIAPVERSIKIPHGCKALNPIPWGGKGDFAFSFLCRQEKGVGFNLKFYP